MGNSMTEKIGLQKRVLPVSTAPHSKDKSQERQSLLEDSHKAFWKESFLAKLEESDRVDDRMETNPEGKLEVEDRN
jgi:hypothetical protein